MSIVQNHWGLWIFLCANFVKFKLQRVFLSVFGSSCMELKVPGIHVERNQTNSMS